jgi:hypothetical protein
MKEGCGCACRLFTGIKTKPIQNEMPEIIVMMYLFTMFFWARYNFNKNIKINENLKIYSK